MSAGFKQILPPSLRFGVPKPTENVYYFKGSIKKMVAYNRKLTQAEITAIVAAMKA